MRETEHFIMFLNMLNISSIIEIYHSDVFTLFMVINKHNLLSSHFQSDDLIKSIFSGVFCTSYFIFIYWEIYAVSCSYLIINT